MTDRTFFVYVHTRRDTGEVFYVGKGTRTPLKGYVRSTTTSRRNPYWRRVVSKSGGFDAYVIADFFSEADAFDLEKELIAEHGRQVAGGSLCNLTAGGEGHAGHSPSAETRLKMADKHRGKSKPEHVKRAVSAAQSGVPNPAEQVRAHAARMMGAGNPNFGKKNSPETITKRVATRGNKCSGPSHPFFGKKRPEVAAKLSGGNAPKARKVVDSASGQRFDCIKHAAQHVGKSDSTVHRWLTGKRPNPTTLEFA